MTEFIRFRTWFLISLTAVLLFLPPSVTQLRNPPPPDFVFNWWLRLTVAFTIMVFNLFILFGYSRPHMKQRIWHYVSIAVAVMIAAMLLLEHLEKW